MKHISFILLLVISFRTFAQNNTPQAFTYQAIARDPIGNVLQTLPLGLRFTIHDGTQSGTIVFQETDNVTTNQFGLFSIGVGSGFVTQGSLQAINWSTGNKYLEVELDATGGTNYTNMGSTMMTSVPYAQNSSNAGNWYDYAIFDEIAVSGNPSSTTLISGSWSPRYLNHTQTLSGSSISISGNDTSILLQPGTYHITASAPYAVIITATGNGSTAGETGFAASSVLRIQRTSPAPDSTLLVGQSKTNSATFFYPASGDYTWVESYLMSIDGVITITSATNISLEQYTSGSSCNGGNPISSGENEIYARITIQRIQ